MGCLREGIFNFRSFEGFTVYSCKEFSNFYIILKLNCSGSVKIYHRKYFNQIIVRTSGTLIFTALSLSACATNKNVKLFVTNKCRFFIDTLFEAGHYFYVILIGYKLVFTYVGKPILLNLNHIRIWFSCLHRSAARRRNTKMDIRHFGHIIRGGAARHETTRNK